MAEGSPNLAVEQQDDVVVMRFENVSLLDESTYKILMDALEELGQGSTSFRSLIISMEGIKLVSTAIWGKLFVLNRKLQKGGGSLAICALGPLLRDAVRVLRLDRLLSVADTVDDARREVRY
jgi:anti-anti-sigma factor